MQTQQIISNLLDSNTYIAQKNSQCLIIDAGASCDQIEKYVGGNKVLGLLLTHGHYDHCFHAKEIAKKFGCKIYASKKIVEMLKDAAKNYGENFVIDDFSNFVFIDDQQSFSLGDFQIGVYSLPGHSQCSLGFLIDDVLFSGDVLFKQGVGRTDLYGGNKKQMLQSLIKIQNDISFATLASGHGQMSTRDEQKRNLSLFIRFLLR